MINTTEFYFGSQDGQNKIHAVKWEKDGAKPKAVLQIAHGIAEYIMRYDEFARFIAENDIVVVGNDHLGHGKSVSKPEDKGFFASENGWGLVLGDMKHLYSITKEQYMDIPYFLLGHSMGSFLARNYIIDYPYDMDGCIISGTGNQAVSLCDVGLAVLSLLAIKKGKRGKSKLVDKLLFGSNNNRISNPETGFDWLSRDKAAVKKYVDDPDCGFASTIGIASDMLGGIKYILNPKNTEKMNRDMPIFFFSGEEDPVGEYGRGVKKAYLMFKDCGMKNVSIKLFPGGRHEMLNEINKREVYDCALKWLISQVESISAKKASTPESAI